MALKKNFQETNPYVLSSIDSIKFMQANYFSTGSNNAASFTQKLEMIKLIAFLTQIMNKKNPEKYSNSLDVMSAIFNVNLSDVNESKLCYNISPEHVRSFALLCDDLLWGTNEELKAPEGFTNVKEIRDKIITYFTDEWTPF